MTEPNLPAEPLVELLADLNENGALARVRARLAAGDSPVAIIADCQAGLEVVGERYEAGEYFISGLVMAGEIFRRTMLLLEPLAAAPRQDGSSAGRILLCTVQGDIHALGKDLVGMLLAAGGWEVVDLGVDVSPAEVAEAIAASPPDVVGLSAMLATALASMKATVEVVREAAVEAGRPIPVIIGGGAVSAEAAALTGADAWTQSAAEGVRLIRGLAGR